jgi:predicted RNA binding protein YcfA (HicA-like mRNA interferase family)
MIPKDITGKELVKRLQILGYVAIRQNGSHIRVQTEQNGKHSETVPNHDPMKQGTLRKILKNIANHFNMTLEELDFMLFVK